MKINRIPKPWDYKATCEVVSEILKLYFNEKDTRLNPRIYGSSEDAFGKYHLIEITEKTTRGWFRNKKVKQEKQVARFEYFPTVSNVIKVYIDESNFTEVFKDKLYKIETYCQYKIEFNVKVQEGK